MTRKYPSGSTKRLLWLGRAWTCAHGSKDIDENAKTTWTAGKLYVFCYLALGSMSALITTKIPGTKRVDHRHAVKIYERAAGDKTLPSDLRPPPVLKVRH